MTKNQRPGRDRSGAIPDGQPVRVAFAGGRVGVPYLNVLKGMSVDQVLPVALVEHRKLSVAARQAWTGIPQYASLGDLDLNEVDVVFGARRLQYEEVLAALTCCDVIHTRPTADLDGLVELRKVARSMSRRLLACLPTRPRATYLHELVGAGPLGATREVVVYRKTSPPTDQSAAWLDLLLDLLPCLPAVPVSVRNASTHTEEVVSVKFADDSTLWVQSTVAAPRAGATTTEVHVFTKIGSARWSVTGTGAESPEDPARYSTRASQQWVPVPMLSPLLARTMEVRAALGAVRRGGKFDTGADIALLTFTVRSARCTSASPAPR